MNLQVNMSLSNRWLVQKGSDISNSQKQLQKVKSKIREEKVASIVFITTQV